MIRLSTAVFFLFKSLFFFGVFQCFERRKKPPNILWITVEDISPDLGCYGDSLAHTPTLDALASKGFRYNHAIANARLCTGTKAYPITECIPHLWAPFTCDAFQFHEKFRENS